MKIYLLRHAHRGYGEEQDSLTEIGLEQSRRTAEFFCYIKLDKIICSNKNRVRETAKQIMERMNCAVEYTSEINEQELGIFEGRSGKELQEAVKNSGLPEKDFRPEGGENREDVYNRTVKFYKMLKKEKVDSILIVSHAGFISDLIALLLELPESENVHFKTGFCAISYFELDKEFKVRDFYIGDLTHFGKYAK